MLNGHTNKSIADTLVDQHMYTCVCVCVTRIFFRSCFRIKLSFRTHIFSRDIMLTDTTYLKIYPWDESTYDLLSKVITRDFPILSYVFLRVTLVKIFYSLGQRSYLFDFLFFYHPLLPLWIFGFLEFRISQHYIP